MNDKYKPTDFNKRAVFGAFEIIEDDIGNQKQGGFKGEFTRHYKTTKRTFEQEYSVQATKYEDTTTIVVRHGKPISDQWIVKLADGNFYEIVTISPDDSNNVITYDFVTIKRKKD